MHGEMPGRVLALCMLVLVATYEAMDTERCPESKRGGKHRHPLLDIGLTMLRLRGGRRDESSVRRL